MQTIQQPPSSLKAREGLGLGSVLMCRGPIHWSGCTQFCKEPPSLLAGNVTSPAPSCRQPAGPPPPAARSCPASLSLPNSGVPGADSPKRNTEADGIAIAHCMERNRRSAGRRPPRFCPRRPRFFPRGFLEPEHSSCHCGRAEGPLQGEGRGRGARRELGGRARLPRGKGGPVPSPRRSKAPSAAPGVGVGAGISNEWKPRRPSPGSRASGGRFPGRGGRPRRPASLQPTHPRPACPPAQ